MKQLIFPFFLISCIALLQGQSLPAPTSAETRLEGFQQHMRLRENSLFQHLPFTNIGPTVFSGRVVDVDVNPANTIEMYVAYASGGLWYTENNGTTFTPVFDHEACMTIGDIAVNWREHVIWVGTGENNSSRSSYAGTGLYKSTDHGKTWKHMGLAESHHIGRIVIHPVNPNIVHVACLGALYSQNENRGVYTTSDGGTTWNKTLYVGPEAGAIDLVMDPSNPNVLYAASWERTRRAWNFSESGEGSGIYKSTDSGRTWELLTKAGSGFPHDKGVGRIGLDIARTKGGTVLYAIVDNQNDRPKKEPEEDLLTKVELSTMSTQSFLDQKEERVKKFLEDNGFPEKYDVDKIKSMMKKGTITPLTLVEYLQDANTKLFETEVIGPEVYKSLDAGKTWVKSNTDFIDHLFYTYGYYFGQIRIAKTNPERIYILGVPALKSEDGGATWKSIEGDNVHGDHHALWVDPKIDGHLVLGNDGGLNISYDDGAHWIKCNQPAVGQFYSVAIDMAQPYNVYGGLQDNGVWVGPSTYEASSGWQNTGRYPYKFIYGGDGMQVAVDTRDNNTVYTGSQFGNYARVTRDGSSRTEHITPDHDLGERPFRWNWETPIHLSVHNQDILYMGAEKVFRSFDQGKNFKAISDDLTKGVKEGDIPYGTITSLHESPLAFGVIYAGSDDGYIHVTKDGGDHWTRISDLLPQDLWTSSLQASAFEKGRVYASLSGYRWDNFESYVFVSEDYGAHWRRIALDLPAECVNVVREDPDNQNILYIGTDQGLYVSLDRGMTCMLLGDLPSVAIHDLAIQPREHEIVVGTHGRSFYKADVTHLQKMNQDSLAALTCFDEPFKVNFSTRWGTRAASWMDYLEPTITFPVFAPAAGKANLQVFADSLLVHTEEIDLHKGLSYYAYHLICDESAVDALKNLLQMKDAKAKVELKKRDNGKFYLPNGRYKVIMVMEGQSASFTLEIKKREG